MGSALIQAGELPERARAQRLTAIILSIVPPLGGRDGRYLCRRVRGECPALPIVAGLWSDDMDTTRQRLRAAGATRVVTTLREAVESVEALANKNNCNGRHYDRPCAGADAVDRPDALPDARG